MPRTNILPFFFLFQVSLVKHGAIQLNWIKRERRGEEESVATAYPNYLMIIKVAGVARNVWREMRSRLGSGHHLRRN